MNYEDSNHDIVVLQNYRPWLAPTENWIYTQLRFLPPHVESHVVSAKILEGTPFIWPRTFCYGNMPAVKRLRVMAGGLPALGKDYRRHSALLSHAARSTGADIVHSHFGFTGQTYARVVRKIGLRHVVTFYGVDASMLPRSTPEWGKRYREMFSLVDKVLCEGPHLARTIVALGCPQQKVLVHHLGVPLGRFEFRPRIWQPSEPLKVLIAASFREKKGIPYALEALSQLRHDVNVQITLIGDASSRPASQEEKRTILRVIEKHDLGDVVRMLGYQPHQALIEHAYRNHIFLSPSVTAADGDSEGGAPVAIIEMAATGMPIVSTRHADIPSVLEDGVGALLAEERDIEGLVKQLRHLAYHPEQWAKMARTTRNRIEREYNAEVQGLRLAEIYRQVVANQA